MHVLRGFHPKRAETQIAVKRLQVPFISTPDIFFMYYANEKDAKVYTLKPFGCNVSFKMVPPPRASLIHYREHPIFH